jgi:sensor domain CHASE-containing protein
MKSMTCRQLGGACEKVFRASRFDEMAALSREHAMEMFRAGDEPHLKAMKEMQALMDTAGAMEAWMDGKRQLFDSLPGQG